MRTRNTLMHPLLIDAILARDGAWVIEESAQMEVIGRAVLSGSESDRQITAALMTLSQEWRRVVYYADVEGFSHKEIAEMMNTPVGTVVSWFIVSVGACGPPSSRSPFNAVLRSTAHVTTRCAWDVTMNGAVMTPDSVVRWWVSLQRGFVRVGGWRCSDDKFAGNQAGRHDGRSARAQVSHFETPIHLMLRRSPSAHGGVMSRRGQCNDPEELRQQ